MIVLNGWAGLFEQRDISVVGETAKRYRIRADKNRVRLAGRFRYLEVGQTVLVPKHAVVFLG